MRRLVLSFVFISGCALAQEAASPFGREFLPIWERACAYTLETAEAMPESLYGYRPDSSMMTFAEHLLHIAENLYSLTGRFVNETGFPEDRYQRKKAADLSKADIEVILQAAFDEVKIALNTLTEAQMDERATDFWSPDTNRRTIFLLMRDHMTHHRGALVVYLRLCGVTPPKFRGW